jgi:hypothetical protein
VKYWVCPICGCVNVRSATKCDGCGVSAEAMLLWPSLQWVEFYTTDELDRWISTMQRMIGAKVWRKKEVQPEEEKVT